MTYTLFQKIDTSTRERPCLRLLDTHEQKEGGRALSHSQGGRMNSSLFSLVRNSVFDHFLVMKLVFFFRRHYQKGGREEGVGER